MSDCFFTDIHAHFLFGVDDGARTMRDSLRLVEQAAENNIRRMLATPHVSEIMNEELSKLILANFKRLKDTVVRKNYPVEIFLASEILFNEDLFSWIDAPWSTVNNNKKYILFELPFFSLPQRVDEFIFQCKMNGITPILAHPERYFYLHNRMEVLLGWHSEGCLMQMDAGSIIGQFGKKVQNVSKKLARMNFYSAAASDAHHVIGRNYITMYDAFDALLDFLDREYVSSLFCENPNKIIDGEKVVQLPLLPEELKFSFKTVVSRVFGKNKW